MRMTIAQEYVELLEKIAKSLEIPRIKEVFIPVPPSANLKSRKWNFGALELEDGSIGIVFVNLSPEIKKMYEKTDVSHYSEMDALELVRKFTSPSEWEKTLGLAAINAISQHFLKEVHYQFDFTTNSLGLLNLRSGDTVGMVGFFPPLIKQINEQSIKLIVIEKKEHLVRKKETWEVTLDPSRLLECNKILCTSTTVLNDTIDEILRFSSAAEKFSIIGPTAGFLPDPLFNRGVDVVGGTYIDNPDLFMRLIKSGERWGPSTRKYCIVKGTYEGFESIPRTLNS